MINDDTIVAISTLVGISALSIVRLSGSRAKEIAKKLTKSSDFTPRYAHLKYLYNASGNIIDRCIVIYFKAPNSFNGEDIIEFQSHGGIAVPKNIVEACIALGARLAKPGEFSKRAILNNKLDISMAENISKLILSQSKRSSEILGRLLRGDLSKFIESFRGGLVEILAHIEVLIDYAEEDLPAYLEDSIHEKLEDSIHKLDTLHSHSLSMQHIIDGHRLVIIGRPNVGKSSLLNRLLLKDRAIISEIEGTTRDALEETITIDNQLIKIIDTAGIRKSSDKIEQMGVDKSLQYAKEATIIIALFDGSREFDDSFILDILGQNKDKIIIAAINKKDKAQLFDESKLAGYECIKISTLDSSVFALREMIGRKISQDNLNSQDVILTTNRQLECIKQCIDELRGAKEHVRDFEIFSFHINCALHALDMLTKPFSNDEMLDTMFGEFCLGK